MRISDFFIDRPTVTTLITAAIAGFGILSAFSLPISNLPEVEYPSITVTAELPGANPSAMASTVATPLENAFGAIPGLANMTSTNTAGRTQILLEFELRRPIDAAAQDVQAAISRSAGELPAGMPAPPAYSKVNQTDAPILWLEMTSSTMSLDDFAQYANDVFSKRISMVSGVSEVPVWGPERPAIRVEADPARLAARGLDLEQVRTALAGASASMPAGTLFGDTRDYTLQADSQLTDAAQFANAVIAWHDGAPLRVGDVADVRRSSTNERSRFWINGRQSVILAVRKQPGVNTVEVADHVKAVVRTLIASLPPGVTVGNVADEADQVRDAIAEVNRTLGITIALVILVIFAFLRTGSATLIAAATIPVSVLGSFIAMRLLGYSIDLFSMLGITLSIGFVVDDAIVVIENVVRHREMGKSRAKSASDGAAEVAFTVASMTVSLVAVFLPILFLNGVLGRLLREFAVAISVSIVLSGFTALTLTPMLASRFLRTGEPAQTRLGLSLESLYQRLEGAYRTSLDAVLRHARLTLLLTAALAAATVVLFAAMPKSFVPQVDTGSFSGSLVAADGSSTARMIAYGEQVNAMMARLGSMRSNLSGVEGPNTAWIHVNLTDDPHRPEVGAVMADLQRQTDRIPGLKVYLRRDPFLRLSGDEGRSQYAATLQGPDEEELYRWAPKLKDALSTLPQLANVSSDLELSAPRLNVAIRRDLATSLDVDPGRIASTLYDAYGSRAAGTVTVASRRYDVLLDVADRFQQDPEALQSLSVRSGNGRLVPLETLTKQTEAVAPLTVNHSGQFPAVTFQFDLRRGTSLDNAARLIREAAAHTGMPATLSFAFRGTAAQFQSSLEGLGVLLLIAIAVIYLVLGILYESFIHPVTILSGLPPAAIGALLALLFTGEDLNLYSFLGILLLIGIAKKNAIMIVDFALHAQRVEKLDPVAAAYHGCLQRFRPITMTTAAALLGSVPVAFAGGIGGEVRRPLGIAVIGGLLLSQLLTLYVTPVLYTSLNGSQRRATLPASLRHPKVTS